MCSSVLCAVSDWDKKKVHVSFLNDCIAYGYEWIDDIFLNAFTLISTTEFTALWTEIQIIHNENAIEFFFFFHKMIIYLLLAIARQIWNKRRKKIIEMNQVNVIRY